MGKVQEVRMNELGFSDYAVTEFGDVISYRRGNGTPLKGKFDKDGYFEVSMTNDDGDRKYIRAHRLVAAMFINVEKFKDKSYVVNHKDGNVVNNKVSNLEFVLNRDNIIHGNIGGDFTSKYPGVHWNKKRSCWASDIQIEGKKFFVGYFDDEVEAAKNYVYVLRKIGEDIQYVYDLDPICTNPSIDQRLSELHIEKKINKKVVIFKSDDVQEFESIRELCRQTGMDRRQIQRAIADNKTCRGYKIELKE